MHGDTIGHVNSDVMKINTQVYSRYCTRVQYLPILPGNKLFIMYIVLERVLSSRSALVVSDASGASTVGLLALALLASHTSSSSSASNQSSNPMDKSSIVLNYGAESCNSLSFFSVARHTPSRVNNVAML